jgi:capsular polysaccharide transport system permease protein
MAEAQLKFIKTEHQNIENQLEMAQSNLLQFQSRYNLIDPTAEGLAMQQITYGLESQISAKEAELDGLLSIMSLTAPRVIALQSELTALQNQLQKERNKLSTVEAGGTISVSQILGQYTDLKVKLELALQAYTGSQVSLEKSRIEAYRQLKYLVTVASPSAPESAKYPNVTYNILLVLVALSLSFVVGRIILSTIRELR